ncbi:carboxypeptidase regulatory-like domain-containing protein [Microbulbifer sp. TYP-18]|uniref:carboxypeptidase regulatory-like domain-containing protein n=1 Tax=Microbulbifer sp. TYP-18 TaxID=3230024 RepID=UPI0034C62D12
MFEKKKLSRSVAEQRGASLMSRVAIATAGALFSISVAAQQSGSIEGQVFLDSQGAEAAGITVTATSNVMPRARTATTDADGEFRLPALIPGTYTLTFTNDDGLTRTVTARVLLDQQSNVTVVMVPEQGMEEIQVFGEAATLTGNGALSSAIGADVIGGLPVGQDFRDMMKLIPGVQYTENGVRGVNAGGSGQDNVYKFGGVNVTLPLFGVLSAEPSSQDVEQMSVERGGARAIGFKRSAGVEVNTKTKSGTNEFRSSVEYQFQTPGMREKNKEGIKDETSRSWLTANVGGPIIEDQLFFYGSYYGPRQERDNKETAYGPTKDFTSERDEYFGKLTYAPIDNLLFNVSYRTSERVNEGDSISFTEIDSVSRGSVSNQDIFSLDGSWVINDRTTLTFQYSDYALEGSDVPDNPLDLQPAYDQPLDLANLDSQGYFEVPSTRANDPGWNAFVQPFIDQYGYIGDDGSRVGGGAVGGFFQYSEGNYYNRSFEIALDHSFDLGETSHELHFGYQYSEGEEQLARTSNGWGIIEVIDGSEDADAPNNARFLGRTEQMSFLGEDGSRVPSIDSFVETQNFEINDSISWGDFTFDVGVLISQDTLYGQGLRRNSATVSGYVADLGRKYEMYQTDWKDMIQPRLGVTWAYNGNDTIFANFAQYNPDVSSLARAASWDRNTRAVLDVYWDEDGNFIESTPRAGSSGKFFQEDLTPRRLDELTIGTTKDFDNGISLRSHIRYSESSHFWEDTWNGSRLYGCYASPQGETCVPDHIAEKGLYIPELDDYRAQLGGSSYVIAELDDAYTKYWEFSMEATWVGERTYLNASYTRSRYRGNFDQDNTSGVNDQATFVGSSNLADGIGRQVWDLKDGTLRGDKPNVFKVFGQYTLDWQANLGAFLVYQSGEPWEAWDGSLYGYSSSTNRYAERAGSRRSPSHWQLDLNYTQNFQVFSDYTLKFRADLFNVFDRQTGYNFDPFVSNETFGEPRNYYAPRRLQLSLGVDF